MVFNGDSDDQDICTLADDLAGSNDVSFPLKQKARFANMRMREIWSVIWNAYGGWIADDSNNSGSPEVTANLVTTARNVYAFATAQLIRGMEWLDANGNWNALKKITLEEIQDMGYAETEFEKTAGMPRYYRPVQNGVRLYPDPSVARTSALKAKIARDISPFTSASTATSPGFDSTHHEGVAIGMAYQYALINRLDSKDDLAGQWSQFLERVALHWKGKFAQDFPKFRKRPDAAGVYL